MEILEQIIEFFEDLFDVFIKKPLKIMSISAITYFTLPILKWFISAIKYIIKQTPDTLNKFTLSTFSENIVPWYLGILINPFKSLIIFLLIILFVTIIFYLKEHL